MKKIQRFLRGTALLAVLSLLVSATGICRVGSGPNI